MSRLTRCPTDGGRQLTIGAFPEQVVGGYPPEDLVQWPGFMAGQRAELERFAKETSKAPTVYVLGLAISVSGQLFNAAAVVHRGKVVGLVPKEKLPTYNVFYEARTFSRGGPGLALDADGVPLGDYRFSCSTSATSRAVCEDACRRTDRCAAAATSAPKSSSTSSSSAVPGGH